MELSRDDIITILNTVRESGYQYFNLEVGDLKVTLGESGLATNGSVAGADSSAPAAPAAQPVTTTPPEPVDTASPAEPARNPNHHVLTAPVVGVFFSSPSPDDPPYVSVGDRVEVGDTVGLIEVMKVYNSVASDVAGTVVEVIAENNAAVEYGQPLLVVDPDGN